MNRIQLSTTSGMGCPESLKTNRGDVRNVENLQQDHRQRQSRSRGQGSTGSLCELDMRTSLAYQCQEIWSKSCHHTNITIGSEVSHSPTTEPTKSAPSNTSSFGVAGAIVSTNSSNNLLQCYHGECAVLFIRFTCLTFAECDFPTGSCVLTDNQKLSLHPLSKHLTLGESQMNNLAWMWTRILEMERQLFFLLLVHLKWRLGKGTEGYRGRERWNSVATHWYAAWAPTWSCLPEWTVFVLQRQWKQCFSV